MKFKCSCCGCNEYVDANLYRFVTSDGDVNYKLDAYACQECGHIELYMPEDLKNQLVKRKQEIEAHEKEIKSRRSVLNMQLGRKKSELNDMIKIVRDENQTVKEVNNAKARIPQLEEEIKDLENKIALIK
jgi:septal ring factor EnvC (AmiA/AmiB activator)